MKKLIIISLFSICSLSAVIAQEVPADPATDSTKITADTVNISKNFIKLNLTSLLIKNYSLQYERIISRNISLAMSFRVMPESTIPYTDNIFRWFDITDPEDQEMIENLLMSNYAITPEIRFYTGKKRYGNGFYISLFYQYGNYSVSNVLRNYEPDTGGEATMVTSGDVSSHTAGFMLGSQWALGKHMCLDWWIFGPHFGISSGDVLGLPSTPLSEGDQQIVEDELNDIDIPMFTQTVEVTADKVTMIFDGPWGGIRAGLSIGIKF